MDISTAGIRLVFGKPASEGEDAVLKTHCTAQLRHALVSIALDPDLFKDRQFDDSTIEIEFRQLHAAHPEAPVCADNRALLEVAAVGVES